MLARVRTSQNDKSTHWSISIDWKRINEVGRFIPASCISKFDTIGTILFLSNSISRSALGGQVFINWESRVDERVNIRTWELYNNKRGYACSNEPPPPEYP